LCTFEGTLVLALLAGSQTELLVLAKPKAHSMSDEPTKFEVNPPS